MRRVVRAIGCAGLAVATGLAVGCFSDRSATSIGDGECRFPVGEGVPGSTVVVIRGFAFEPAEVRVRAGERVTWISCDEESHTSTADEGAWSSPLLPAGQTFTHQFVAPGEFSYHCEPHQFMTGDVIVE